MAGARHPRRAVVAGAVTRLRPVDRQQILRIRTPPLSPACVVIDSLAEHVADQQFDRLERKLDRFIDTQLRTNDLTERRLTRLENAQR